MIITGQNLLGLIQQHRICPERLYDRFSITLELDDCVFHPRPSAQPIRYDIEETDSLFEERRLVNGYLVMEPGSAVLACSSDSIQMPAGYMGWIQGKGSLARLFVSVHCSDSQIEPGYAGKVTFELVNHAPFAVSLAFRAKVAQMYVFKCSNDSPDDMYNGRYQNAKKPTIPCLIR